MNLGASWLSYPLCRLHLPVEDYFAVLDEQWLPHA
jgi:hypothetical protein